MTVKRSTAAPLLGSGGIEGNNFLEPKFFFLTDNDFVIETLGDLADEDTFTAAIASKQIFPLGEKYSIEKTKKEAKYSTSSGGVDILTMPMMEAFKVNFNMNEDQAKIARETLPGKSFRLFYSDYANQLKIGKYPDGYKGFRTFPIYVEKAEAGDSPAMVQLYIQMKDTEDMMDRGVIVKLDWPISELQAITPVTGAASAVQTNTFTIVVKTDTISYINEDGTANAGAIMGLESANFQVLSSAGVARAAVAATESTTVDGKYSVTGTGVVATDTVQIIPSASNLYESAVITLA
jgi:hypothetical protein